MPRPAQGDYAPLYENYVKLAAGDDVFTVLNRSWDQLGLWLGSIPEEKLPYSYAPGKWTVGQMLQHLIDSERVFAYRAMCFARGEKNSLPGFDENAYAARATAEHRGLVAMKEELLALRKASITLYNSFTREDLAESGIAFGYRVTVNAMGFIMAGHIYHHQRIYEERYLP
jgi:hypothetical protein